MSKLTREKLQELRTQKRKEMSIRDAGKEPQIVVGLGTCGIAAGANDTLNAIKAALAARGLAATVMVRQSGCMGLCHSEPTVEVCVPGMPSILYGHVGAELAAQIVEQHVMEKRLLDGHICDRPALDIVR
jgi:NADP-reducing hydrogenase subunit HndB